MNELNEIQSKSEQKYLIFCRNHLQTEFQFSYSLKYSFANIWWVGSLIYIDESENETWNAEILLREQTKFNYRKNFSDFTVHCRVTTKFFRSLMKSTRSMEAIKVWMSITGSGYHRDI